MDYFKKSEKSSELKWCLLAHNLYIGTNTFSSGFVLVLHEACRLGDVDTVDYILKHHVHQFDINHATDPLLLSKIICAIACYKYKSESLMHAAVREESINILKMLVDYRASLETTV